MPKLTGYTLIADIDTLSSQPRAKHALGQRAVTSDGRMFSYARAGAVNLVVGHLLQSPVVDTNYSAMAVAANVAADMSGAGPTTITVTNGASAVTADQFAGGLLEVEVGAGAGQTFTVLSNTAAVAAATITFIVDEPVRQALASATSTVTARVNVCNGVIDHPTVATGVPVGVAVYAIPATEYGWIQIGGESAVLSDVAPASLGQGVQPSAATAGAVTVFTGGAIAPIGTANVAGIATQTRGVTLRLD